MSKIEFLIGDCRKTLENVLKQTIDCVVTSPPYYGLRTYIDKDSPLKKSEIGQEETAEEYIENLSNVFDLCRKALKDEGICFVNIQDSYKNKNLIGIPWMFAFEMCKRGWYWRDNIIWAKATSGKHIFGTCMPESVKNRTNKAHEYILMFSKSEKYYYDWESIAEPIADITIKRMYSSMNRDKRKNDGEYDYSMNSESQNAYYKKKCKELSENPDKEMVRIRRSVWTMKSANSKVNHFAIYPPELAKNCILLGCPKDGIVLDPFGGSGTTGIVANILNRNAIVCELNPNIKEYFDARKNEVLEYMESSSEIDNNKEIHKRHPRVLW